ncbi:ribosomal RNA processing protein 36 homolog [Thrips palmi]|uniref:rRNA biogenesis protein RRP36 n=1 Tax=Thrips palmi TaxID=161013 RepID=A0A6P8ZX32_THRPL|nr:ribosomal RNA processing protein 36 homolog [Thrips palmi]
MEHEEPRDDEEERTKIRDELSTMSFEELQKLKEKLGTKVYNEAMFGKREVHRNRFKRENKNRPREMSSKKPVPVLQQVLPVTKKPPRDPRFDSLCGEFNEKAFKAAYGFISEYKRSELKQLKEELKTTTDPTRKSQIKYLVQRMENQFREIERQKKKQAREEEEKTAQIEAMKEGKTPYFRKKVEKRMVDLIDQYEELKKKGKVSKKIEKYRQKIVVKNRKKISGNQGGLEYRS